MIATLRGSLQYKSPEHIIIDVHGVGYEIFVPETTLHQLPEENQEVFLHIHTHVREDALLLFGFASRADKQSYRLLLTVSGVGPKLAMAIVAAVTPGELARAVSGEDITRLIQVSGVGKKTAKRLCLELKDKVEFIPDLPSDTTQTDHPPQDDAINPAVQDCISALINLGYAPADAEEAVAKVFEKLGEEAGLQEMLRQALQSLA